MSETYQPDPNQASFCQICGRSVASEADRLAGNAFHCGLCNEIRLASPASTGYAPPVDPAAPGVPGAGPNPAGMPGGVPRFTQGAVPFAQGAAVARPNPGLAALLGLIPGVGAMYNGQYAKGIVHLVVFAILVNLADSHDIFGLFVAGWIFYQAIEAYHTARARRDGTPLPNPFGLNDIGERLGFGKSWPTPSSSSGGASTQVPPVGVPVQDAGGTAYQTPPVSNWGAPWESYRPNRAAGSAYPPFTPVGYGPPPVMPQGSNVFDGQEFAPFDPSRTGFDGRPTPRNRFPAGAIWLIALGTIFLLNTSGLFRGFPFRMLLPLLFLGLGSWIFVHRMTDTGHGLTDDGSPAYRIRLFRAARGAVWLMLLGVIFFLADFDILPWSRSWPLFLILAGVMAFLERAVYSGVSAPVYGYPGAASPVGATAPASETVGTAEAGKTEASQEGR